MKKRHSRTFPAHTALKNTILQEWRKPEKVFLPNSLKRRFLFKKFASLWAKCQLDAALSKVAKKSDLSFEDAGSFKDIMDRKAKGYLRMIVLSVVVSVRLLMFPHIKSACDETKPGSHYS